MNNAPTNAASTRAPRLSTNPFNLFEQATRVEKWCAGADELGSQRYVLLLGRRIEIDGERHWQIAGYFCDSTGEVFCWHKRFDTTGKGFDKTGKNLIFRIVNHLIEAQNIENIK